MNILITGSEGVIGRRLVSYLREVEGVYYVYTCDRIGSDDDKHTIVDITYPETLRKAFDRAFEKHYTTLHEKHSQIVFHLAASVGREASEGWASVALRTNVEGTQNVVDLCLEYGARLIYVSSSEVYGDAFRLEEKVDESFVCRNQLGIYGLSKWLGEQVVDLATDRHGLYSVIARPFMCYSEGEPLTPYRSAIARFMRAIVRGEPITVHEGAVRSWCYVDDMVEGLARLGLSELTGAYNVGRHEPYLLEEVASALGTMVATEGDFNTYPEIITKPMPPGIYPVKHASFDKIKRDTGWDATTTLEEGLKKVVERHFPLEVKA